MWSHSPFIQDFFYFLLIMFSNALQRDLNAVGREACPLILVSTGKDFPGHRLFLPPLHPGSGGRTDAAEVTFAKTTGGSSVSSLLLLEKAETTWPFLVSLGEACFWLQVLLHVNHDSSILPSWPTSGKEFHFSIQPDVS